MAVEAGPCRVAVGGGLERKEEKTLEIQREIARRLIERFGARDPGGDGDATAEVMGTVVRLLEAFRGVIWRNREPLRSGFGAVLNSEKSS